MFLAGLVLFLIGVSVGFTGAALFTELEPDIKRIKGIQYINKVLDKVQTRIINLDRDVFIPELTLKI